MQDALSYAPITAGVDGTSTAWNSYTGGVITSTACGTTPTYFVLIVGWGNDSEAGDFWLVKGSFSLTNNTNGYAKVGITPSGPGICGI